MEGLVRIGVASAIIGLAACAAPAKDDPHFLGPDGGHSQEDGEDTMDAEADAGPFVPHEGATLRVNWGYSPNGFGQNFDQWFAIETRADHSRYVVAWKWTGTNEVAEFGIETDGLRRDNTVGDTLFFRGSTANNANGPGCADDSLTGGTGWSCRHDFTLALGHTYRLRVWTVEGEGITWWAAYLLDTVTNVEIYVGRLRVAEALTKVDGPSDYIEYFGEAVPCDEVPESKVLWKPPLGDQITQGPADGVPGTYQVTASVSTTERGDCTGGGVTNPTVDGFVSSRATLGGSL